MARRIRVVEMIYGFGVEGAGGGAGRFGVDLSRSLDRDRFDVSVFGLWNRGTPFEEERIQHLNSSGIPAFAATDWDEGRPYRSFWRAVRAIRSVLSQHPADILHSHHEFADVAALLLKPRLRSPRIMRTVHNGYRYEWRKRPLRRLILTNLLYPVRFDMEIGVSQSIVETLDQRWLSRLLGRQAVCVHNAIDLERFMHLSLDPLEKRRSLGLPADAPLIGTVGRLTEEKGYAYLLEAAALVLRHLPHAHFLIVGDGPLRGPLAAQAQRLGIEAHVIFAGPRSDVEACLACLDLFVSSSLWEGFSTVIMESMAAGVPVVATDTPGARELVQPGITGWLVPPANDDVLADAILTAIASASVRGAVAHRAQESVRGFSIEAVARKYEALYESVYGCQSTLNSPASST